VSVRYTSRKDGFEKYFAHDVEVFRLALEADLWLVGECVIGCVFGSAML
jgi:hypothetical protein